MPSEYRVSKHNGKTNGTSSPATVGSFSMKSAVKVPDFNGHVYNLATELRHAFGTNGNVSMGSNGSTNGGAEEHIHTYNTHTDGKQANGHRSSEQACHPSAFNGITDFAVMDEIVSSKGTIRGVKNRVRAGIATFLNNSRNHKVSFSRLLI